MAQIVKIAIIGFGLATDPVVGPLTTGDRYEIVACADPDPISRDKFTAQFNKPVFNTAEELFAGAEFDAVYIATPTRLHESLAIMAFDHGKHVLVEKPISTSLEAAERMVAAADKAGRVLMVNHKRSVDRNVIGMWQLTKNNGLGRVRAAHRWHYSAWFYRARAEDERDPAVGGVVLRQGAHEFDVLRLLLPSVPVKVRGVTGDWDDEREGEGSFHAWVECGDGTIVTVIHNGYDYFQTEEFNSGLLNPDEIAVDRRRLAGESAESEHLFKRQFGHPRTPGFTSGVYGFTLMSCDDGDLRPAPDGALWLYDKNGRRGLRAEGLQGTAVIIDEFYRAITEGFPALHDGSWGLAVLELCLAIRESAKTGEAVTLSRQGAVDAEIAQRVLGDRVMAEYNE